VNLVHIAADLLAKDGNLEVDDCAQDRDLDLSTAAVKTGRYDVVATTCSGSEL
jgi:hypothetical protein